MESVDFFIVRSMYYKDCTWNRKQEDMANTAPIKKMVNTNIYSEVVAIIFQLSQLFCNLSMATDKTEKFNFIYAKSFSR